MSVAEVAPAGLGVATRDQLVPLKFSASVVGPEPLKPTAQTSVGETAKTALKVDPEMVGLGTTWKPLERSWRGSSGSSPGVIVGRNRREILRFIGLLSWLNK